MFETSISHNNVPVIRIDGKIIGGAANALKREMDKQIEQSRGGLVLDMANVPLLDSTALGIIIATLQFLQENGWKTRLAQSTTCCHQRLTGYTTQYDS